MMGNAYAITDLSASRHVVGWMVAAKEASSWRAQLFAAETARHGTVDSLENLDRGSAMKSDIPRRSASFSLGATPSFQPPTPDDNASVTVQNRCLRYQPDYSRSLFPPELHHRPWLEPAVLDGTTTTTTIRDWRCSRRDRPSFGRVSGASVPTSCARFRLFAHPERFLPNTGAPLVLLPLPPPRSSINLPMATAPAWAQEAANSVVEASIDDSAPSAPGARFRLR
jgi:hypothetical protein